MIYICIQFKAYLQNTRYNINSIYYKIHSNSNNSIHCTIIFDQQRLLIAKYPEKYFNT